MKGTGKLGGEMQGPVEDSGHGIVCIRYAKVACVNTANPGNVALMKIYFKDGFCECNIPT